MTLVCIYCNYEFEKTCQILNSLIYIANFLHAGPLGWAIQYIILAARPCVMFLNDYAPSFMGVLAMFLRTVRLLSAQVYTLFTH